MILSVSLLCRRRSLFSRVDRCIFGTSVPVERPQRPPATNLPITIIEIGIALSFCCCNCCILPYGTRRNLMSQRRNGNEIERDSREFWDRGMGSRQASCGKLYSESFPDGLDGWDTY
ncbi:hypothetical protein Trydic_g20469 [Trypoxylus dichotomus]